MSLILTLITPHSSQPRELWFSDILMYVHVVLYYVAVGFCELCVCVCSCHQVGMPCQETVTLHVACVAQPNAALLTPPHTINTLVSDLASFTPPLLCQFG